MDSQTILRAVTSVTKHWAKQRKSEERQQNRQLRRREALTRCSDRVTLKEAAEAEMEAAYLKASANGTLPATARQIMYAARGPIQEATDEMLDDKYFTQSLLPAYLREHPETTADWDVVFDARGHFQEPHTRQIIPLGTLAVRSYLSKAARKPQTNLHYTLPNGEYGPGQRFGAILFIEKEGFAPLLDRVQLAERYDVAIMSTKGMSVTAARTLVDRLCGEHDIPLLVLHDFDKAGFSIVGSLGRSNARYQFKNEIEVIDLGLRLEDVEEYDLESENVTVTGDLARFRANLKQNGATPEEIAFLARGQRVELNAMDAGQLVSWIEEKLEAHGVKKVVPGKACLEAAYRRALQQRHVEAQLAQIMADAEALANSASIPAKLAQQVKAGLKAKPHLSWDDWVAQLAYQSKPRSR